MTYLNTQSKKNKKTYEELLKVVCSLSGLFSENEVPYLYYRIAEKIFCKAFLAKNITRKDASFDAQIGKSGIGLKTFISESGNKLEKVAEFNKLSDKLQKFSGKKLAVTLGKFRNERIETDETIQGVKSDYYHCVARKKGELNLFEVKYEKINISKIKNVKTKKSGITFEDGINEYSFNKSKSTLFKRFRTPKKAYTIDINVLEEPFEVLTELLKDSPFLKPIEEVLGEDYIILPLYSETKSKGKFVPPKAQLNHWNAGGRTRTKGEIYIAVPKRIHDDYPNFFPPKDEYFDLEIPTGEVYQSKICQSGGKALMTKDNDILEQWLLRDILKLKEGELLTYERLAVLGFDSVKITKVSDHSFKIDVADSDDFEDE